MIDIKKQVYTKGGRIPRFGVLLPIKYKKYLWDVAASDYTTPPRYVQRLIDEDQKRRMKEAENGKANLAVHS